MPTSSYMGNMGNRPDVAAYGASRAGGMLPDRAGLPFVNAGGEGVWQRGQDGTWSLQPDDRLIATLRDPTAAWREYDWSAEWYAWLVLSAFTDTKWRDRIKLTLWEPADEEAELAELIKDARPDRSDALDEILAQAATYQDIMAYFLALAKMSGGSHPSTYLLLHVAGLVGILVTMHFKQNPGLDPVSKQPRPPRARASQVCPALMPPVAVPGHPSFPSGHATQSMLMALCLGEAMQNRGGARASGVAPAWPALLQALSHRIARNRELAGLHFPSDSAAGFQLARQTFDLLHEVPLFQQIMTQAVKEWP